MVLTDILLAELELVPISGPPWGQRGDPIMELKERFWQLDKAWGQPGHELRPGADVRPDRRGA